MTVSRNRTFLLLTVVPILIGNAALAQEQKPEQTNPATSPNKNSPQERVTAHDSIVVGAHLTPEEVEDGKIQEAYQPVYQMIVRGVRDCEQIVKICETEIIPRAEKSKFPETRNKFLYSANRDIADCEFRSGKYDEAGKRYEKLFEYASAWPGKDDSSFPQIYESIGAVRMKQGRWEEAQTVLEKAVQIFEEQIEKDLHSDSEFIRNELTRDVRMSEADSRDLLAAVYFREGRKADTMTMLEEAYQNVIQSNAKPERIQRIITDGRTAAMVIGDEAEIKKWDGRLVQDKKEPR